MEQTAPSQSWRGRYRGQGVLPLRFVPGPIIIAGTGYRREVTIRDPGVETAGDRVGITGHAVVRRDFLRRAGGRFQRRIRYGEICHDRALHTKLPAKLSGERVQLR